MLDQNKLNATNMISKMLKEKRYSDISENRKNKEIVLESFDEKDLVNGKYVVPYGVTKIGELAFAYGKNLISISIPETVEVIDDKAFIQCTALREVELHEGLRRIGAQAFAYCKNLSKIVIPKSVQDIEYDAFSCTGIRSLKTLGEVNIGNNAFEESPNLENIELAEGITELKSGLFVSCPKLKKINIPSSVTSIEPYAFANCQNLETVVLNDGSDKELEINEDAFEYDWILKEILYNERNKIKIIRGIDELQYIDDIKNHYLGQHLKKSVDLTK